MYCCGPGSQVKPHERNGVKALFYAASEDCDRVKNFENK